MRQERSEAAALLPGAIAGLGLWNLLRIGVEILRGS